MKSDVYSLGVITHEMLSGHRPPIEPGKALRSLRELKSDISSKVEAVVQKATKDEPSERYQSVTGFLNALEGAIKTSPIDPSGSTTELPPHSSSLKQSPFRRLTKIVAIGGSPYYSIVAKMVLQGLVAGVLLLLVGVLVWSLPATHSRRVGGGGLTDLSGYCQFLRYAHEEGTADRYCFSSITILGLPLTKQPTWTFICNWENGREDFTARPRDSTDPYNPDGMHCYDTHGTDKGGVDLGLYCHSLYSDSSMLSKGKTVYDWKCQQKIDMTSACRWQYPSRIDAQARDDGNGNWDCYGLFFLPSE